MYKGVMKHTLDEKIQAVLYVLEGKMPDSVVAKKYTVSHTTIQAWIRKYQLHGVEGLKESTGPKTYSKELKMQAVEFYLNHEGNLEETCKKFDISSRSVLSRWVKHYTSGKEFKSTGGREAMNKGRKTTLQERIEIVQYTIANECNYHEAAKKYNVSYQQVYSWVRKYGKDGKQGLQDHRGKTLESKASLTEEEKLQHRIKELEHRNQYLEAENGLLKKLKEIERGMGQRD